MPPLRHHIEDVQLLVPFLLARLGHGGTLTCSPEAMQLLLRASWPGNVEQVLGVLRGVAQHRRTGVIRPDDLPPESRRWPAAGSARWSRWSGTRSCAACWTPAATRSRRPGAGHVARHDLPQDPRVRHRLAGLSRRDPATGGSRTPVPSRLVRALRRFTVRASLPPELAALSDLVMNLRWSWHQETLDLFASVDPELWRDCGGDPVRLLGAVSPARLSALSRDKRFLRRLSDGRRRPG